MLKWVLPVLFALVTMGIVMVVVLAMRPELRAELGRLRRTEAITIEPPTS